MGSFSDACTAWAKATPQRLEAVRKRAIELLADEMTMIRSEGGRLPFKTGNLRRSLLASTSGPVSVGDAGATYSGSDVGLVVAGMAPGDTIWLGFQAAYAKRLNYGFVGEDSLGRVYNQEGAHFIEGAIADWPILVQLAAEDIEASVTARNG